MHLASGTPWVPLKAEQWYSVRPPGFVWYATLHIGPVPIVRARDMYLTGEGRMLIKAASLVTVADAKGKEFDQGEMVRYLSEMIWSHQPSWRTTFLSRRSTRTRLRHPHPWWQDGIRDIIPRPRGPTDRVRGTAVWRHRPRNLVSVHRCLQSVRGAESAGSGQSSMEAGRG